MKEELGAERRLPSDPRRQESPCLMLVSGNPETFPWRGEVSTCHPQVSHRESSGRGQRVLDSRRGKN